jgi:Phage integrase family
VTSTGVSVGSSAWPRGPGKPHGSSWSEASAARIRCRSRGITLYVGERTEEGDIRSTPHAGSRATRAARGGIGPRTLSMYRDDLGLDSDGNPNGNGAVAFFGRIPLAQLGPAELRQYAAKLSRQGLARSSVRRKPRAGEGAHPGRSRSGPRQHPGRVEAVRHVPGRDGTPHRGGGRVPVVRPRPGRPASRRRPAVPPGKVAQPKGRKTRRVRVSARLDAMLWEHRKATRGRDNDLLFTGPLGARVDAKNLAARMLKPACRAAGVGNWPTWHTFRHTAATMLFRNGWNAPQVSRHLGHADAGFTLRTYVHLLDNDQPEPSVLDSVEHAVPGLAHRAHGDTLSVSLDVHRAVGHDQWLDRGDVQPILGLGDVRKDGVEGVTATLPLALDEDAPRDSTIVRRGATAGQHATPKPTETNHARLGGFKSTQAVRARHPEPGRHARFGL